MDGTDVEVFSTVVVSWKPSCIFGVGAGISLSGAFVMVASRYDYEWGCSNRLVELAISRSSQFACWQSFGHLALGV